MKVHFNEYNFQIKETDGKKLIFDPIRKKWVVLNPEEWVRQHWIHYLKKDRQFPRALLSVEMPLELNGLRKRADIVAFDRQGRPFLIIECKAPKIPLSQATIDQAARYNITLQVPVLVIANGKAAYGFLIDWKKRSFYQIDTLPNYDELIAQASNL